MSDISLDLPVLARCIRGSSLQVPMRAPRLSYFASARAPVPLPSPAILVIFMLAIGVPATAYLGSSLEGWQTVRWPELTLLAPFSLTVRIGRCVGALLLAVLLLRARSRATIAVTIVAVWLAGPPIDLLLTVVRTLALSHGKVSWQPDWVGWLGPSLFLPAFVTGALLVPAGEGKAYRVPAERDSAS